MGSFGLLTRLADCFAGFLCNSQAYFRLKLLLKIRRYYYNTAMTCEAIGHLGNGTISYNKQPLTNGQYPVNTSASFTCNTGYAISGDMNITCQASGHWNHSPPTCVYGKFSNCSDDVICYQCFSRICKLHLKGSFNIINSLILILDVIS